MPSSLTAPDSVDYSKTDDFVSCHQVTATIPTAAAGVNSNGVNVTVTGVKLGDIVTVSGPTVALLHMVNVCAAVTATDTVTLSAAGDATGYTGASKVYNLEVHHKS